MTIAGILKTKGSQVTISDGEYRLFWDIGTGCWRVYLWEPGASSTSVLLETTDEKEAAREFLRLTQRGE